MAVTSGNRLLARALKRQGTEVLFFIEGGPMTRAQISCRMEEIRMVDVRHEQAAAMMAHAYARVTGKPGVCMASAGPGVTNLVTGVANAFSDCAPVIALGGSFPLFEAEMGSFQELDQVGMMKPITKWAAQVPLPRRIPEYVEMAFRRAIGGRPGPVYLDFPGDVMYQRVEEAEVNFPPHYPAPARPLGDPELITRAIEVLSTAQRPLVITGSGVLWSRAWEELREFVDTTGIPFLTTPQGRGVIPEDHPLCLPGARNFALRNADVVLVVGTRLNLMLSFGRPPRFAPEVRVIQVDIEPEYIGHNRPVEVGIVGDAGMVLRQLTQLARKRLKGWAGSPWGAKLKEVDAQRWAEMAPLMDSDQVPIHPARLCQEVRDFLERDAILTVDGNETLHWARQLVPTHHPGHRLNCGPFGCLGVAVPFAIGAKVAKPDKQVLALTGDGSFGLNGMEMDTAIRHKIPLVVVVNNNASWATLDRERRVPGQYLGHQRYDLMVAGFGGYGELVEKPQDIRPALERAFASGLPACINVITDPYIAAESVEFSRYSP